MEFSVDRAQAHSVWCSISMISWWMGVIQVTGSTTSNQQICCQTQLNNVEDVSGMGEIVSTNLRSCLFADKNDVSGGVVDGNIRDE